MPTLGLEKSDQVPFLLAKRARSECARSMRAPERHYAVAQKLHHFIYRIESNRFIPNHIPVSQRRVKSRSYLISQNSSVTV